MAASLTTTQEVASSVSPARMFKAMILDSHNLFPKLIPAIESIQILEGDGGAGSIKQTNFAQGSHFKYLKHKIDAVDESNYETKSTLIESDALGDKLESIVYEVKYEASGTGSVCKATTYYHAKAGVELNEEEIKSGEGKAAGIYKLVEDYLVANPDAYA